VSGLVFCRDLMLIDLEIKPVFKSINLYGWIKNYYQKHPIKSLAEALNKFMVEMEPKRLKSAPN